MNRSEKGSCRAGIMKIHWCMPGKTSRLCSFNEKWTSVAKILIAPSCWPQTSYADKLFEGIFRGFLCTMDWYGMSHTARTPDWIGRRRQWLRLFWMSRLNIRLVTDETVLNLLLNYFIEKSIRFIWFRVQYPLEESKDMKFSNKWWFCLHVIGQLIM